MAMRLKVSDEYNWPVEVKLAVDGGRYETGRFDARFKRLSQERLDELALKARNGEWEPNADQTLVDEVLVGWNGVTDEHNVQVPFSESSKQEMLRAIPGLRSAILKAFFESTAGGARKN